MKSPILFLFVASTISLRALEPLPESGEALMAYLASTVCRDELRAEIAWQRSNAEEDEPREILDYLASLLASETSQAVRIRHRASIHRILTSMTDQQKVSKLPPPNQMVRNVVWGSLFGHGIPLVPVDRQQVPVAAAAAEESVFLRDASGGRFLNVEELAGLTPMEIASLDIGPDHPFWLSSRELANNRASRPERVRSSIEQGLVARLHDKGRLAPGSTYSLDQARRVLFLDQIGRSATSPKVDAEDAYGVEWKLKWGDEPAVEPVASRLYLLAGGRETDLVFANGPGRGGVTLVLEDPSTVAKAETSDDQRHAATLGQLSDALEDLYGFDLMPYVHDAGTITRENVGDVLALLPGGGKKSRAGDLIGREWVTFRESGSELKPDDSVYRIDGAAVDDPTTAHDRGYRAAYLFDLWIQNGDVKPDNNKVFFQRSHDGDSIKSHSEGHHDLGLAFGGLFSSGTVNRFRAGGDFAREGDRKYRFHGPLLFKPKVWGRATWSDGKWMARHLAAIRVADIEAAVAASLWPDFVQAALVHRLVARRNAIATLFGEGEGLDGRDATAPSMSFDLSSSDGVRELEKRYQLPAGSINEAIAEIGLPFGGRDVVLREATITSCKESPLVRALTQHRYPSGLAERYRRQSDKGPTCD